MSYMLDSDTFSYLVREQTPVLAKVALIGSQNLAMSVISQGEVLFGLARRPLGNARQKRLLALLDAITVLPLTAEVATAYSRVRAALEGAGIPIGPNDYWIAAHALSLGVTLVTNNTREFKRVKGLKVDNWVAA
jgi:tRNA(fMet)-specific endonuclease VapC